MTEHTQFSNQEILNGALLSSMAYVEDQYMREGNLLQNKIISTLKVSNFLTKHNISKLFFIENSSQVVDLFAKELTEDPYYGGIVNQKTEFYTKFKDEMMLKDASGDMIRQVAFRDSLIESKKQIVKILAEELSIPEEKINNLGLNIDKEITQVKIRESNNINKELLNRDVDELWQKFTPIIPSQEMKNKFKCFSPKNNSNIEVEFKNGYIQAGKVGGVKDASLLIGYVEENGQKKLYISFRGTEKKAKSPLMYFAENYPNMERQYNYFEPILKQIIEEAIDENNKNNKHNFADKLQVVFTGHSLGAALAEKALDKFKDNKEVVYKGILVSNPGSFHYLQKVVNKLDEMDNDFDIFKEKVCSKNIKFASIGAVAIQNYLKAVTKTMKAGLLIAVGGSSALAASIYKGTSLAFEPIPMFDENKLEKSKLGSVTVSISKILHTKFFNNAIKTVSLSMWDTYKDILYLFCDRKEADLRACTINHERDNVPQVGKALFQNFNNQQVVLCELLDKVENANVIKKYAQFEYHGREHYYGELNRLSQKGGIFTPKEEKKYSIFDRIAKIRENSVIKKDKEIYNAYKY